MSLEPRTDHDQYIGERIREARIAHGLTQGDLADMLGISYQQVQKYERGYNRLDVLRMARMITALNRPFTYFFPNPTDVRPAPVVSSLVTTREGHRVAELWPQLTPADRLLVLKIVERLAA